MMTQSLAIGVDMGGTKIEVAAMDEYGGLRLRRRVPTPAGDYAATVRAVAELVRAAEREVGATQALPTGVGIPGSISPRSGLIRNANSVCLNGQPLKADLEAALARPLHLENDANCLALSEARDGAGKGAAVVFAVILGTGVGGGVALHGQVLTGRNRIAGEWSHNPLPWMRADEYPGPVCWCGQRGCIETFLSGPGLAADFLAVTGERITAREVARRADTPAQAALDRYEERLARALAGIINILDPDVIVLGGGVSNIERLYTRVPERWTAHVFADVIDTPLRPARFGDSSGVRGAAYLGRDASLRGDFC